MEHRIFPTSEGTFHRFIVGGESVIIHVRVDGPGRGFVSAYEREYAKANGMTMTIQEAGRSEAAAACRNMFGTGVMLKMFRAVRESMPEIKVWVTDNRDKRAGLEGRVHERSFHEVVAGGR